MSLKERFRIDHHHMVIDTNDEELATIGQPRSGLAPTAEVGVAPLAGARLPRRGTANRSSFDRKFTPADVRLPAHTDHSHGTLSGPATKVLPERGLRLESAADGTLE